MSTDKKMTLKGPEAITLWKQGKEAWNQWVKEHPEADIDFSRVAFGRYRYDRNCQISADAWPFAGFQFPKGEVNFSGAEFGNGNVNFVEAQFGDGNVNFFEAQFGDGTVSFSGAEFGNGNVNFVEAQFGDGNVSFIDARFGKGTVSFSDARFGNGTVDFWNARFGDGAVRFGGADFGDGDVRFEGARFGKGTVSFSDAEFGEGNVNFFEAQFGDGTVSFSGAEFGNGNVNFWNARFGEGTVNFWNARFGDGAVSFDSVKFEGPAGFSHLTQASSAFSFRNAHFGQSLTLSSKNHFTCVPDFINTHMGHHMSLRGVHLLPQLKTGPEDIGRFCRLKELAEGQKDHERALEFKAQEILATRQHQNKGLAKILPWCFEKGSNYGRSELRPLVGLTGGLVTARSGHYERKKRSSLGKMRKASWAFKFY